LSAKSAGVVDHVTFLIMRRLGLTEAFTNDRHFETAGFILLFWRQRQSRVSLPTPTGVRAFSSVSGWMARLCWSATWRGSWPSSTMGSARRDTRDLLSSWRSGGSVIEARAGNC